MGCHVAASVKPCCQEGRCLTLVAQLYQEGDKGLVLPGYVGIDGEVLSLPLCVGHIGILRHLDGGFVHIAVFLPSRLVCQRTSCTNDAVDVCLEGCELVRYLVPLGKPGDVYLAVCHIEGFNLCSLGKVSLDAVCNIYLLIGRYSCQRPEAQLVLPSCAFLIAVVEHIIVEGRSQSSYTNLLNRNLVHLGGIVVVGHITLC